MRPRGPGSWSLLLFVIPEILQVSGAHRATLVGRSVRCPCIEKVPTPYTPTKFSRRQKSKRYIPVPSLLPISSPSPRFVECCPKPSGLEDVVGVEGEGYALDLSNRSLVSLSDLLSLPSRSTLTVPKLLLRFSSVESCYSQFEKPGTERHSLCEM